MSSHINGSWHQKHPMPKKPTLEQRVDWHLAHAKACGCRDIPKTVIAELQRRGQRESGVAGVSNISRS
jgi:hypothetical protein